MMYRWGWDTGMMEQMGWWLPLLLLWEFVWKGFALWRSARNEQLGWYLAIFILNTAGILPILYLAFFRRDKRAPMTQA